MSARPARVERHGDFVARPELGHDTQLLFEQKMPGPDLAVCLGGQSAGEVWSGAKPRLWNRRPCWPARRSPREKRVPIRCACYCSRSSTPASAPMTTRSSAPSAGAPAGAGRLSVTFTGTATWALGSERRRDPRTQGGHLPYLFSGWRRGHLPSTQRRSRQGHAGRSRPPRRSRPGC